MHVLYPEIARHEITRRVRAAADDRRRLLVRHGHTHGSRTTGAALHEARQTSR